MSSLPKGTVPASSPSKKGHSSVDNVERSERHLASVDRILRSVPSPGMGH
ncbi:Precursor of CEP14 [Linum grandiflorum]